MVTDDLMNNLIKREAFVDSMGRQDANLKDSSIFFSFQLSSLVFSICYTTRRISARGLQSMTGLVFLAITHYNGRIRAGSFGKIPDRILWSNLHDWLILVTCPLTTLVV